MAASCAPSTSTSPASSKITVHPQDGGRVEPPEPEPPAIPPANGIPKDEAAEIARTAVPEPEERKLSVIEAGRLEELMSGTYMEQEWVGDLPADLWVWRVFLVRGDEGIDVVVDYLDGPVLGTAKYIVN